MGLSCTLSATRSIFCKLSEIFPASSNRATNRRIVDGKGGFRTGYCRRNSRCVAIIELLFHTYINTIAKGCCGV